MKFAVIGDVHFHYATIRSRIDNVTETVITKFNTLRDLMLRDGIPYLFILGDVFHKAKQPSGAEYKLADCFLNFKDAGITIYSIVGNHDLLYDRLDTLSDTSLGLFYLTDIIKPLDKLSIDNYNFYGVNFPKEVPIPDTDGYNICFAHKFFNNELEKGSLSNDDINDAYRIYFLGHDHAPYDPVLVRNTRIIRPGSFLRNSVHDYNLVRNIHYYVFDDGDLTCYNLPCEPADKIFAISYSDKEHLLHGNEKIATLVEMLSGKSSFADIFEILDSMNFKDEVKEGIEKYLKDFDIYR